MGAGIRRNKANPARMAVVRRIRGLESDETKPLPLDDAGIAKAKPPDGPSSGRDARSLGVFGKLVGTPRILAGSSGRREASRGSIGGADVGRIVGCSASTGDRP